MSASLRNSSEYVGEIIGTHKITKEDLEAVARMERQFMKNTGFVRADNRKK